MSAARVSPNTRIAFPISALMFLLAPQGVAHAQSVNYAELEGMLGEPVTTSVTGKPQRASETPADLVIITRDDIRRSPANDIPGLLQAYAGIDVIRWTRGQADVSIRGGVQVLDPRLLVLVNGRQVYLDYYGMTNWAGLGVQREEIQQIEIVRGPNSALFGFNAVSGVINIITIDPLQTRQLITTIEAGSKGHLRLSQSTAIKLGNRLGLRLSGGYQKSDELKRLNASPLAPLPGSGKSNPSQVEAAGELYAHFDDRTNASLNASYSDSEHSEFTSPLFTVPVRYRFAALGVAVSRDSGWGVISARVLHNWSAVDVALSGVAFRNKVFMASTDALVRAGTANTLRSGFEYRRNQLKASPGYPGAIRYEVYAASGMWEHGFSDAIVLTLAGRVDHLELGLKGDVDQPTIFTKQDFARSITAFSFNSAMLFRLSDTSSLRLAAGRGIQAPSLYGLGGRVDIAVTGLPFPLVSSGNPAIEPARISSAEVGFTQMIEPLSGRLELTGFYNRMINVISQSTTTTTPRALPPSYPFILLTSDNVGSFKAFGVAASLTGRLDPNWTWAVNYTWTRAKQHIVGNSSARYERPLALDSATPDHKVKAQLSYETGPWLATVAGRYTSHIKQLVGIDPTGTLPLALVDVDDSLALDAKVAFKVSDTVMIAVAGENLTNADGAGLSPAPAERRLRASLQIRF